MIKAVFLDAIKTIFAPYPTEIELYKQVIRKTTGKMLSDDEVATILTTAMAETERLDAVRGNSIQQWEYYPSKVAELVGCEKSECKAIGDQLRYETWGNPDNYRLYSDIIPTLKLLREKGIYVACVSNEDGWLSNFFDQFEISEYFNFVLTSDEIGVEKPNPKIFLEALSRTDFKPEEVLFVGDSLISDYEGAKAVGMKPLLIDRDRKNKQNDVVSIDNLIRIQDYML